MHIDAGPAQVFLDDAREGVIERATQFAFNRNAAMTCQVPLGKQFHLAAQQCCIVCGQYVGLRCGLPGDQRVDCLQVDGLIGPCVLALHRLHHGLRPQIGQQHEAFGLIPCQHLRRVQAGLVHETGDLGKGSAVFLRRRRIHDDAAALR